MILESLQSQSIKQQAITLGFHKVGIASLSQGQEADPTVASRLQQWLNQGYHADMTWMSDARRQDIYQVMPDLRSLICVGLNYYTPHPRPSGSEYAKISRYGWGRDYHRVVGRRIKALSLWLKEQDPKIQVRYYVDTGPVQDKVWAERAGIGWIGKHSNLISRDYGSWLFLGEILTNLELEPDRPHTQHCGSCTRCITACPTDAIRKPFVVDANRCIAYHTIENRDATLPDDIAGNLQGWVAGCDICQDVCPWNQRFAQETDIPDFHPYPENVAPTLEELATLSVSERDRRFRASALRRIKLEMLQRNATASLNANTRENATQRRPSEPPPLPQDESPTASD
ncbi:tRNA epoxyqueuosine(34) reductase QueG [Acaryochloris sp. IP29b_bin.148]|uniref:tRNA epoxyqueuosine(34) reductase QueG n=1 Tax=Acaryochloris sp. IP29b_bin.148 TaxID=2969218 RepID=UPI0026312257|nr:tRNA epoxyqueuosine(34) reductase QueG [Acaryochloris sp. IP29b_bin.148]